MSEELEDKARKMGWVSQEEFRGDPDNWVDAGSFVERGENMLPILKERYEKLSAELEEVKGKSSKEVKELQETLKRITKAQEDALKKMEQTTRERTVAEYEAAQRQAAEAGDLERFDEIAEKKKELQKEPETEQPTNDQGGQVVSPSFMPWQKENPWYGVDNEATAYAHGVIPFVKEEMMAEGKWGDGSDTDFYERIGAKVKEAFPHKFENPARKQPGDVSGEGLGTGGEGKKAKKPTYDDLPPDAKEVCDRYVKTIPNYTVQEYLDVYFEEEE